MPQNEPRRTCPFGQILNDSLQYGYRKCKSSNDLDDGVHVQRSLGTGGTAMSMTCKATIRLICEYLEGRLAPEVAGDVQRHVSYCPNCRTVFDAAALTLEVYFDRQLEPSQIDRSRVA